MAKFGSAPDLSLTGVQATVYGKKPGGSRPTSAAHAARKRAGGGFDYEYSVVESLPNTHDAHGWPIVQKEKKTNTPIVGRSRANSAGTVKSFHSEQGGPRTNKSALLRQRLIAIERNQNSSTNAVGPKKPKNSRVVSASRRKPMKSQENSHRSDKSTAYVDDLNPSDDDIPIKKPLKITAADAASRRSNGSVYSFLGETEPHDDDHSAPKPNLKINLDGLNDETPRRVPRQMSATTPKNAQSPHPTVPKLPAVENTARKKEMLDDIFQSTLPKVPNSAKNKPESDVPKPSDLSHELSHAYAHETDDGGDHANFSDDAVGHSGDDHSGDERFMSNLSQKSNMPANHLNHQMHANSQGSDDDAQVHDRGHVGISDGQHLNSTSKHDELPINPSAKRESPNHKQNIQASGGNEHAAGVSGEEHLIASRDEHLLHNSSDDEPLHNASDLKQSSSMQENHQESVDPSKNSERNDAQSKASDVEPKEPVARPPSAQHRSARTPVKTDTNLDDIFQQQPRRMASVSTLGSNGSDNTLPHQHPQPLSSSHHGSPSQSFGNFGSSPGSRLQSGGGFFQENFDTDRTTHRPSAREFYANQRSVRNSKLNSSSKATPTTTASEVDDAESLTSGRTDTDHTSPPPPLDDGKKSNKGREKISARLNSSQKNSARVQQPPNVPDAAEGSLAIDKYNSIKDYLHQVKSADDERRNEVEHIVMTNRSIQLSNTPPNKVQYNDVQDSLVILVHQMIEEKRALADLCAKLLQQMQITTSKLVEIETRQEKSLIALIEHRNGIKIDEVLHSDRHPLKENIDPIDWKKKYEDFLTFHSDETRNLRQKYDTEIELLKYEFQSKKIPNDVQTAGTSKLVEIESQTEADENHQIHATRPEVTEVSVQTDEIFNHRDDSDDETDAERAARGIMSDDDGVKNRLLNVSEEKTQLESLLGERNTEIERLKSKLDQVVDEQAEFTSHLSSKLTNRIEDLQGENSTLKNQLTELERRCTELASLLNANLSKTETVDKE